MIGLKKYHITRRCTISVDCYYYGVSVARNVFFLFFYASFLPEMACKVDCPSLESEHVRVL